MFVRVVGVLLALGALIAAPALADESPRAVAALGVAVPVFAHTLYSAGVRVQAGAESGRALAASARRTTFASSCLRTSGRCRACAARASADHEPRLSVKTSVR